MSHPPFLFIEATSHGLYQQITSWGYSEFREFREYRDTYANILNYINLLNFPNFPDIPIPLVLTPQKNTR